MDTVAPIRARCQIHPGAAAVALCDGCGRGLCLDCAIPVRGEVVGSECLASVLPDPPPVVEPPPPRPQRSIRDRVAMGSLAVVAVASVLPWTHFGVASSLFGAWGLSPYRHSTLVGPVAVIAVVALWFASRPGSTVDAGGRRRLAVGAGLIVSTLSILALTRPPSFTRPTIVPFLAIAGGLAAILSPAVLARLRPDRTKPALA